MTTLADLDDTSWKGTSELWLDPLGNQGVESECTLRVSGNVVSYAWSHEGKNHEGRIRLSESGAEFSDDFHSAEPMSCRRVSDAWGLFQVQGEYGPESDWRWRIGLFFRAPTSQLVLLMTNVAPWGEEVRAVRMTLDRA